MKHVTLPLLLLMALYIFASAATGIKAPAFLKPGDKIAIISPASPISSRGADTAYAVLQRWGFTPVMGANICNHYHGFAGTVDERKADLVKALTDTTVKAIFCTRGGYGSLQILNKTNLQVFRNHPKWIIGYSDITALHSAEVRAGNMSLHANMAGWLLEEGGTDTLSTILRNALMGQLPDYKVEGSRYNNPGKASGILVGGNLTVFNNLAGTPYDFLDPAFMRDHDFILFFEDVHENFTHVDRMIHQLQARGVLSRLKGIIVGKFKDYRREDGYTSMHDMLYDYLKDYKIPICYDFPTGHFERTNYPMIEGCPVTLDVQADSVALTFHLPTANP